MMLELAMKTLQAKQKTQPISLGRGEQGPAIEALADSQLDELKFRIVRRGKCHYLSEVRFRDDEEGRKIATFLEGQALEHLNPDVLRRVFGTAAFVVPLQVLLGDLKSVFC
jgi:hypothetical protein